MARRTPPASCPDPPRTITEPVVQYRTAHAEDAIPLSTRAETPFLVYDIDEEAVVHLADIVDHRHRHQRAGGYDEMAVDQCGVVLGCGTPPGSRFREWGGLPGLRGPD